MTVKITPGMLVRRSIEESLVEWTKGRGPGHTLQWVEDELLPHVTDWVDDAISLVRESENKRMKQSKLEL